ncbi:hypothetical protein ABVN80_19320 [Acinetobacter baumannii]
MKRIDNSEDPGKSSQDIIFTLGTFLGGAWGTPDAHYATNLSLRISLKKNSIPS